MSETEIEDHITHNQYYCNKPVRCMHYRKAGRLLNCNQPPGHEQQKGGIRENPHKGWCKEDKLVKWITGDRIYNFKE